VSFSLGERNTRTTGAETSFQIHKVGVVASAYLEDSDGFSFTDPEGAAQDRALSDYQRLNLTGKMIYNPSSTSEIMVNAGYYHSNYGIPPDLVGRPRFWEFKDWNRTSVSAGGFTTIGKNSLLRLRGYYVNYYNVLNQYTDDTLTALSAVSTYDNPIVGFFGLGEFPLASWNTLKTSVYYEHDQTRQQDDTGLPWTTYKQGIFSVGAEDHFSLADDWKVILGASVDALDKFIGGTTTKVNPLVGLKYSPSDALDVHLSFATKSKFPSMRSLYSSTSGNPDLKSEFGRSFELSGTYNMGFFVTASIFLNSLRDFINSIRMPDGTRLYVNINKARINGAELQAQKTWAWGDASLAATVNYTFLDHKNETDDRPLDVLSKHNLNFDVTVTPLRGLRLSLFGLLASKSWLYSTSTSSLLAIPSYFYMDAVLMYSLRNAEPFVRVTNVFNHYFYTEPGFPWRGRFVEVGVKAGIF
jgi:outer membrane cobalamin receptor